MSEHEYTITLSNPEAWQSASERLLKPNGYEDVHKAVVDLAQAIKVGGAELIGKVIKNFDQVASKAFENPDWFSEGALGSHNQLGVATDIFAAALVSNGQKSHQGFSLAL